MRTARLSFFFAMLAILNFIVPTAPARAEGEAAKQVIENFVKDIKAMEFPPQNVEANNALVKSANKALDMESMGKKALDQHWQQASAEEQQTFTDLLWKLIENVAYPRSHKFMGEFEILYPEIKADATGTEVHTVIKQQEQALDATVIYHISAEGKVDDVVLDGVSIIEDLRFQFDKIIADSKFSGLLDKMRERLAQAEAENK